MKKKNRVITSIIFLLILAGIVRADDFLNITPDCTTCVPGYATTWKVRITNKGQDLLTIVQLKLKDGASGQVFAEGNYTHMIKSTSPALRSSLEWAEIRSGESATFTLYGIMPFPNNERELLYEFCRTQATPIHSIGDFGLQREFCYKKNMSLSLFDCKETKECKKSQKCINNLCEDLQCGYCQYTDDHYCYSYECCVDAECFLNETCSNNVCSEVACNEGSIINHTCTSEECAPDEALVDYLCRKLECKGDEYLEDHRCFPLDCGRDEYPFNHSCQKLLCKDDEIYEKQQCVPGECPENSYFSNHTCIGCYFFQNAKSDRCSVNIKLLVLIIFIIIIIMLLKRVMVMVRRVQTTKMTLQLLRVVKKRPPKEEKKEGDPNGPGTAGDKGPDKDDGKKAPGANKGA